MPLPDRVLLGDIWIRRIGFGAMRITGRGVWGPPRDPREAQALLQRVVDLGISFIDTADSYGPNVSEELIAAALRPYPQGLVIGTKGGMVRTGPWRWEINGRPEHIRACVEGSLRRLGVEAIDLYQLHRPDPMVAIEESIGVLRDEQRAGRIKRIGICNVDADALARARLVAPIVSVQNNHNLIERTDAQVLDTCARDGLVFFPYFPLGDVGDGRVAKLVSASSASPLAIVAGRLGATTAQVAIAWLIRTLPFAVPIPGTSSAAHLVENTDALRLADHFSQDDLELLEQIPTSPGGY